MSQYARYPVIRSGNGITPSTTHGKARTVATGASQEVFSANPTRLGMVAYNKSNVHACLNYTDAATEIEFVYRIPPNTNWVMDVLSDEAITVVWESEFDPINDLLIATELLP